MAVPGSSSMYVPIRAFLNEPSAAGCQLAPSCWLGWRLPNPRGRFASRKALVPIMRDGSLRVGLSVGNSGLPMGFRGRQIAEGEQSLS